MASAEVLKAPFPYFGGKSRIATLVWKHLGDPDNYVEPFAGSLAVMLNRPTPPKIETVNDLDCMVSNFWRATARDPEAVVAHVDWPVSEIDLHARHRWLVLSDEAKVFRDRMRTDPEYFDAKVAGWWCWGLCCWIGSGWCANTESEQLPKLSSSDGVPSTPSELLSEQLPKLQGYSSGCVPEDSGTHPRLSDQLPRLTNDVRLLAGEHRSSVSQQVPRLMTAGGQGVNAEMTLWQQRPQLEDSGGRGVLGNLPEKIPNIDSRGVLGTPREGRPQLAGAYDIGRGVNSNGDLGTCEQRRLWLLRWFLGLRNRLRLVRVCCGDWSRVCSSDSVTTRLGTTAVFLDPPYGGDADRTDNLYAHDSLTVAEDVRKWCLSRGRDSMMRICLAGYAGEGHEELEKNGWTAVAWKSNGGYGNRSKKGKDNAAKERVWFSPHCCFEASLFDALPEEPAP